MKRILGAFLITVVGIALSWFYLRPQEWTSGDSSNRKVIAKVLEIRNDVNRQAEGRLLWSSISVGDLIYLGDKIKTGGLSFSVIQLMDSASKLEIEENSTIVMSQGGEKLALNMLEGRVFVKQEGQSDDLHLLSGGKKLDLKGDTAISVSKDGSSNIESFKQGQSSFGDLKPAYSEEVLSPENNILLSWTSAPKEDLVEVFSGESPVLMKKVNGVSAKFVDGKINLPVRSGINYWQLVSGEEKSPLMKLKLIRPIAPSPVFPSDKEIIKIQDKPFEFKWVMGNVDNTVIIEVARDPNIRDILVSEELKDQSNFTPSQLLAEGEYYWRVKSKLNNAGWMESPVTAFTIHKGSSIISPTPVGPADNTIFYLKENRPVGVPFEWRAQDNSRSYELKIRGDSFTRDVQSSNTREVINIVNPGTYFWEVYSQNNDGKKSVLPIKRSFEVRQTGKILWSMSQKSFLYLESLPIIILKWEKKFTGPSILKISTVGDLSEAESFQVQGRDFPYRVQKAGTYYAKVYGSDENGTIAAESDLFEFMVQEAPLPPAPILLGDVKKIKATPRGELSTQVENAKGNWLIVTSIVDAQGRVVDERKFSDERLNFNGLLPGKYFLQIKFQDEYKRLGDLSDRVEIEVPEKSMIAAPKLKGIKVR